jgi:hypothetical protein
MENEGDHAAADAPPDAPSARDGLRPRQAEGLQVNVMDDGYVIYQAAGERVHFLNVTAAYVFELCDGTRTFREIEEQTARDFRVADPAANLTGEITGRLVREGLVEC